jgi:hypothetical protein
MFRSMIVSLFATGMSAGCANVQPVLSGGYYCLAGTEVSCTQHEGSGGCQPCPRSTPAPLATAAIPAALPGRPE